MKNQKLSILISALFTALVSLVSLKTHAQDPDVRSIRPAVMVMIDSSGSMESKPGCVCATRDCSDCLPACGTGVGNDEKNRWATVLEALTGSWTNYTCTQEDRDTYPTTAYDYGYYVDHIAFGAGIVAAQDGVLDVYKNRIKFGLMTFDAISTANFLDQLIYESNWPNYYAHSTGSRTLFDWATQEQGGYSYGDARPFMFPGCGAPYMINLGARNEAAPAGALISVGDDNADHALINDQIQAALLSPNLRPQGATPIAAMLTDLEYYVDNHPDVAEAQANGTGDPYFACRGRYGLLLTDGFPNADFRGEPFNCDSPAPITWPSTSAPPVAGTNCPYDTPDNLAAKLYNGGSGDLDGLYVVGFNVSSDPTVVAELNELAELGGAQEVVPCTTSADCMTGKTCNSGICKDQYALFADNREALVQAIGAVFDRLQSDAATRTIPAFAPSAGGSTQYQFNTGFIGGEPGEEWSGVLERRRFECNPVTLEPVEQDIVAGDRFHEKLNNQTVRKIYSVFPSDPSKINQRLEGQARSNLQGRNLPTFNDFPGADINYVCGNSVVDPNEQCDHSTQALADQQCSTGFSCDLNTCRCQEFGTPPVTGAPVQNMVLADISGAGVQPTHFGVSTGTEKTDIINWVNGDSRPLKRMHAIYHASPRVISAPSLEQDDEAFNEFRLLPEVAARPTTVFAGTQDGLLHAFLAEDYTFPSTYPDPTLQNLSLQAGTELWSFIPPMLLDKIDAARASFQWMVDGTLIVRDVFDARLQANAGDPLGYHTVAVGGLREGGNGFYSLDLTDVANPKFLWQFIANDLGDTYGEPEIATVRMTADNVVHERAVVLLPGGTGSRRTPCSGDTPGLLEQPQSVTRTPSAGPSWRAKRGCWQGTGRVLYVLDAMTGSIIRKFDTFTAPVTGAVSVYPGGIGKVASRGFVVDADGVIWRMDFSSLTPSEWTVRPLFDTYFDQGHSNGMPSYPAPTLVADDEGNVTVVVGTGDTDVLDNTVSFNRIISVTEELTFDAVGAVTNVNGRLNWKVDFLPGELVTGPLDYFDETIYFSSFSPTTDPLNLCAFGHSKIWGVHYVDNTGTTTDSLDPVPMMEYTNPVDNSTTTQLFIGKDENSALENSVVMGVGVTQRPTCAASSAVDASDPYVSFARRTQRIQAVGEPKFELVAQISGGGQVSGGAQIKEVKIELQPPADFTRPKYVAGEID